MKQGFFKDCHLKEMDIYRLDECHDMLSIMANLMTDFHRHDCTLSDIEEYVNRFPYIRRETREHILNIMTTYMSIHE